MLYVCAGVRDLLSRESGTSTVDQKWHGLMALLLRFTRLGRLLWKGACSMVAWCAPAFLARLVYANPFHSKLVSFLGPSLPFHLIPSHTALPYHSLRADYHQACLPSSVMALQAKYKLFLAHPTADALAVDAAINYIPTLTTINEPAPILKHLTAQDQQLKKKNEKFLNAIEDGESLCVEAETTLQFLFGGGTYLPGLADHFLAPIN